jgi:hypothetical protein
VPIGIRLLPFWLLFGTIPALVLALAPIGVILLGCRV